MGDRVVPFARLMAQVLERINYTSRGVPVFLAVLEDDIDLVHEIEYEAFMVARIVELHGGTIALDDCPLGGLEVRVVLPRSPAVRAAAGLHADTENRAVGG